MSMVILPPREAIWKWLSSAPLPVVLAICLTTTGALGSYVFALTGEVRDQKATTAVAAEQARAANEQAKAVESRLTRLEEKLDRLLEAISEIRYGRPEPPAAVPGRPRDKEKKQ